MTEAPKKVLYWTPRTLCLADILIRITEQRNQTARGLPQHAVEAGLGHWRAARDSQRWGGSIDR